MPPVGRDQPGARCGLLLLDPHVKCEALVILPPNEAEQILQAARLALESKLTESLRGRTVAHDLVAISLMEMMIADRQPDLIKFDFRVWTFLEHFTVQQNLPDLPYDSQVTETMSSALTTMLDLRSIDMAVHEIRQELSCLVKGPIKGEAQKGRIADTDWHLIPTASQAWQRYGLLNFSVAPGLDLETPALHEATRRQKGTLLSRALALKRNGLVVLNQGLLQALKPYAPKVAEFLRAQDQPFAKKSVELLRFLVASAKDSKTRLFGSKGGVARIPLKSLQTAVARLGVEDVVPRLTAHKSSADGLPLIILGKEYAYFAPELLQQAGLGLMQSLPVGTIPSREDASTTFGHIIADVLESLGYETILDDVRLVDISLGRKEQRDVDVLALKAGEVTLVECKLEATPPGAWTDERVSKRQGELKKYQETLNGKVAAWKKLVGTDVRLFSHGKELILPAARTAGCVVKSVIVSARLEPMVTGGPPVVTYATPPVAEDWAAVLPTEGLAPIWHDYLKLPAE